MTIQNPMMLPKIRSRKLLDATQHMPCTLRVASFIPGRSCARQSTVVPCHLPTIGKGTATKVSDLYVAAGCLYCHDIVDNRDKAARAYVDAKYPAAFAERLMKAHHETIARWIDMGVFPMGDDWEIV